VFDPAFPRAETDREHLPGSGGTVVGERDQGGSAGHRRVRRDSTINARFGTDGRDVAERIAAESERDREVSTPSI